MMALKHSNALFSIELEGKAQLAIAKDVQRDPVRNVIEHVDLLIVKKGEKVAVDVPVHVVGESAPGTIHLLEQLSLSIEADATRLPDVVEVSIEGLEAGTVVYAGDVALPEGATLITEATADVLTITEPKAESTGDEAEAAEGTDTAAE